MNGPLTSQRIEHVGMDASGRYLVACLSDASLRLYDLAAKRRRQRAASSQVGR